jgi:hypothetical protein
MKGMPAFIAVVCSSLFAVADEVAPERPNVLFIAIDDLNDWVLQRQASMASRRAFGPSMRRASA